MGRCGPAGKCAGCRSLIFLKCRYYQFPVPRHLRICITLRHLISTMKKSFLSLWAVLLVLVTFAQSKYNHREAFDPHFYPQSGNEMRSASGAPGPKYWQNRADYKIACALDTASHKVTGEVAITYTNNSPDNLNF